MARLDRLGSIKDVAQTAAAIGREFSYELLAAVSPLADDALQDALGQLVEAELRSVRLLPTLKKYVLKLQMQ